jgi:hypothetical protein
MPKTKGTGIVWLRELIEYKGAEAEQQMAKALSPEDYKNYRIAMPINWISEESATNIYRAAGNILFAEKANVLEEVGRGMAKNNMTGIYSIFLKFVTIPFMLKQASRLWKTYHDSGKTSVEEAQGQNRIIFKVSEFPELPKDMRQVLRGYILGLSELVKAQNTKVEFDESDPGEWRWVITWQ